jgi:hypothetical protein
LSGVPEVNVGIRKLVKAIFRSQGTMREYFTDLFPYMREATRKFNLEEVWNKVYTDVVTGDYELDRLGLFLNHLYTKGRDLFVSFLSYVTKDILDRFHEPIENLIWHFQELKEIGYVWKNKQLVPDNQ